MTDSEYPTARFMRLRMGDDIIAEVVDVEEDNKEYYLLINPVKIVYIPSSRSGYVQLALMPWVFPRVCDHQEFTIEKSDVIITSEVSEKMNKYYWETVNDTDDVNFEKNADASEENLEQTQEEMDKLAEILEQLGLEGKRTFH
jgi:hypothetical protein